jgi:hypothetical protein
MSDNQNGSYNGPDQSTYPPAARGLPQSTALTEAEPLSVQELFSRNPENYSDKNIDTIVLQMRDLRVRLEQTGTSAGVRSSRTRVKKDAFLPPGSMQGLLDGDYDDC